MPLSELSFAAKNLHPLAALPDGIQREFVQGPYDRLEVLCARVEGSDKTPIYFCHAGMGCAYFWLEYMQYFQKHGIPSYAISYRGHGNSAYPSFIRMVWFTTKTSLKNDLLAGLKWVQKQHNGKEGMLVGHSSGGGLVQLTLDREDAKVQGLVLLGAVPGSGSWQVYMQWVKLDRWFGVRTWFHFGHPNSPLSSKDLVKRVFFPANFPDEKVTEFRKHSAPYEAFPWPLAMMLRFVSYSRVVLGIRGWEKPNSNRLLVIAGSHDAIMPIWIMRKMAIAYRQAVTNLSQQKKLEIGDKAIATSGLDKEESVADGVEHLIIEGEAHHAQNGPNWEEGAQKILKFYNQL